MYLTPRTILSLTLLSKEINTTIEYLSQQKLDLESQLKLESIEQTDIDSFTTYDNLQIVDPIIRPNKKTEMNNRKIILSITKSNNFETRYKKYREWKKISDLYIGVCLELESNKSYFTSAISAITSILTVTGFIGESGLTIKGIAASHITECNPILLAEMIVGGYFDNLSGVQIASLLAIFLDGKIKEHVSVDNLYVGTQVIDIVKKLLVVADRFVQLESQSNLYLNIDWELHLGMLDITSEWGAELNLRIWIYLIVGNLKI